MNVLRLSDDEMDAQAENLQLNEPTGMTSDYFNDLNLIQMYKNMIPWSTLVSTIKELIKHPSWKIVSYSDYVSTKSPKAQKALRNKKALSRIAQVDKIIHVLKLEIKKMVEDKPVDEALFVANWHTVHELIFWRKSSVVF